MTDEATRTSGAEDDTAQGLSRRNALKAGVAAGVGVAAWSGASITSLGGTPAYAVNAGCTGVTNVALSGGCDNTDQSANCSGFNTYTGEFNYQHLTATTSGFSINNNFANGTCCAAVASPNTQPVLVWTIPNLQCTTHVEIWEKQNPCEDGAPIGNLLASSVKGPVQGNNSGGQVVIDTQCFQFVNGNKTPGGDTFYKIYAKCNTVGAPTSCIT